MTYNKSNRITLTCSQEVILTFSTTSEDTVVHINNRLHSLNTVGDVYELHLHTQKNTINLYGDITYLKVESPSKRCTGIDISCDTLQQINIYNVGLEYLHISKGNQLKRIECYGNRLHYTALDHTFNQLPNHNHADPALFFVKNRDESNYGVEDCNIPIATSKNWLVLDKCGHKYSPQPIKNKATKAAQGSITESNYYDNTTAVFEIVNDVKEINAIMALNPQHESYSYPKKYWEEEYDFDQILYYGQEYNGEILHPTIETPVGAIGYAFRLGHEDEYSIDNPDILLYPATPDYYVYVIKKGNFGNMLCQPFGREIQSKTWVHNGYVYRFAKFWGKLRQCHWTLNLDDYTDGNQDDFILAKCKLEDFR